MARVRERTVDSDVVARLTAEGVHPVLARLYAARQVRSLHDVNTDLAGLLTPERLRGVQDAARWLLTAIHDKKRILVVADYDADGATACAVAVRGLRRFGADVDYLVPDRFTLGYGLTPALIDHALTLHGGTIDCIVTVDNGISSIDGVAHANAKGIDVLVTDHHLPGPTLPDALIVNPNQPGCSFPSKHLAGVGVMFYVLLALRQHVRDHAPSTVASLPRMDDLLPIVALGTVADVVRLDANNRRLVDQGLQRLRQGKGVAGLNALFQVAQIDVRQANANHLGFAIGPRINAAGRLSDMSIGIQCLLEDDPERALELAQALDQLNRERRDIESTAREEAIER
ncbi:MAG: single-stranded-DNA-specific exonuclease RecJ, partial [Burkholderiaceae bacterium]